MCYECLIVVFQGYGTIANDVTASQDAMPHMALDELKPIRTHVVFVKMETQYMKRHVRSRNKQLNAPVNGRLLEHFGKSNDLIWYALARSFCRLKQSPSDD